MLIPPSFKPKQTSKKVTIQRNQRVQHERLIRDTQQISNRIKSHQIKSRKEERRKKAHWGERLVQNDRGEALKLPLSHSARKERELTLTVFI